MNEATTMAVATTAVGVSANSTAAMMAIAAAASGAETTAETKTKRRRNKPRRRSAGRTIQPCLAAMTEAAIVAANGTAIEVRVATGVRLR